jgi:hypothetical protein
LVLVDRESRMRESRMRESRMRESRMRESRMENDLVWGFLEAWVSALQPGK